MVLERETKKAAPDGANIESSKDIISQDIDTYIQDHYKGKEEKQQAPTVAQFLERGAENARSTQELLTLLGCCSVRQLRQMAENERLSGALILSGTAGGYFLPDTGQKGREEIQRYLATMCAKATATIQATESARKALAIMEGQINLEDKQ